MLTHDRGFSHRGGRKPHSIDDTKTVVVAVGMFDSIHFARWLSQFADQGITFHLFPSSPHRKIHAELRRLVASNSSSSYYLPRFETLFAPLLWLVDKLLINSLRGFLLRVRLARLKPDFIHALELQNAGYIVLAALKFHQLDGSKVIVTNYGSDIFWFQRFPRHERRIRALLSLSHRYSAECKRDYELAEKYGFTGEFMALRPNAGGFKEAYLEEPLRTGSQRTLVMVKGYHGWAGRAKMAIRALATIAEEIKGLEVVVYSANLVSILEARKLRKMAGITVRWHRKGTLSHDEVMGLFSRAKIYVGLSLTDGISTSMLEAMAMGAIPVQTSSSCCDEWFDRTGVRVPDLDVETIVNSILQGLELATDPSNMEANRKIILARASEFHVKQAALDFYR